MKEEICQGILKEKERNKWERILENEVDTNPIFSQFERKIDEPKHKSETKVNVSWFQPYAICNYNDSIRVYTHTCSKTYYEWTEKVGLFKIVNKGEWEWNYDDNEMLFLVAYDDKEIVVYNEKIYKFCKQFAKKHKLKKLIKCWEGVI